MKAQFFFANKAHFLWFSVFPSWFLKFPAYRESSTKTSEGESTLIILPLILSISKMAPL